MKPSPKIGFVNWLKQPGTWLSIIAIAISLITFYMLNMSSGTLEVQLPEQIGIKLNADSTVDVLIPVVFFNTGSPRRQRIITSIKSTITDISNQNLNLNWVDTQEFIGASEFESKYPDKISPGVRDYIIYKSRSVPFVIKGGESDYKLLHLVPEQAFNPIRDFSSFELVFIVRTGDEYFTFKGSYSGKEFVSTEEFSWFTEIAGK